MAPTPGPIPGAIGQIDTENANFMTTSRKSTTVSTKGLLNMPGQNNCFLNSAVQVLWHLDAFRRSFRELSGHSCMAESCIFCALKELFTQFQYSQESALPPDALRHALARTFCDQRRFQLGFMDDAAECFENILLRIHVHIANQEVDEMCGNVYCIPHQKFAMTLVEQRMCQNCSASSEPLPFTQMVHYVTTSALCTKAIDMLQQDPKCIPANFFGRLLRLAGEMGEVRDCPSGCGEKVHAKKTLMNHPEVVSIGLVWDSECPTLQHITDVFRSIGMYLQLQDMFHDVCDINWANATTHQLVGVVTYYGKHYSTFFFHTKLRVWIYFDDATVQEVGPSWEQVVEKCQRGRFQPLLLLFANPDTSVGFSHRDTFSPVIYANDPLNMSPAPANQRQYVINQYLTFQNSKKMANAKHSYEHMRHLDVYPNHAMFDSYSYNTHLANNHGHNLGYKVNTKLHYGQDPSMPMQNQTPVYSNLQYLNAIPSKNELMDVSKLNEISLPPFAQIPPELRTKNPTADVQMYSNLSAFELQNKDKAEFDADKDNDSAYTEEDPEVNDLYISRKAVENVLKQQKHMSLCRSYSQSSVGNRNSSSSLESFDNTNNSKVNIIKNPPLENAVTRRDSGSWSSDRNSSSSNNSVENPFLTVVASKRLLLGLNKKSQFPDSNTSDHGYDSFSVSSSDSYPSVNGSPIKVEPRLTQIPEDWQPEDETDLDKKLKLITEETSGPPDCDKLCAEADLLLAKSHEKEKDGDLVMAALLSDSAAARARAAMEAPYNNSRSLVSAKMKHSTCVMRSSNLYRRLKDHEMDERRKQKGHTGHHSRQSSRDSTHSRHSRQGSKDSTHSKTGSKDSSLNSDDTDHFGKNIEIYGTLPKKGSRKKNASTGSLKVKDDQIYKDFLDKQRKNTNLSNELNETMLKNVDLPKSKVDYSPKRKSQITPEKSNKTSDAKSPTRKKDTLPKTDNEIKKKPQKQVPSPAERNNTLEFSNRDLLSPIPSSDKKPHKIKRKLMGGFMKRKNRSLPDLREDQNSTEPIDCFLDDAIIQVPSMNLPNGKPKKADGNVGTVTRGFHQPHHAFIKKDLTQRPLLIKVNPPNIQPLITSPKPKLIHTLPAISKKTPEANKPDINNQATIKPSKIPHMTNLQKIEPNLPPIPPLRTTELKCSPRTGLPQKTSAIPVLTPQVSLSPIKPVISVKENLEVIGNSIAQPINEQFNDKEDLPLPLNPFLAEIQAKRKQVLNKSLQKQEPLEAIKVLNTTAQSHENKEPSMLPKLAHLGEGTSWLKELQNKQQKLLNKQENSEMPKSFDKGAGNPTILTVPEHMKEQSKASTMNWKLHSENTSEVASSPSIGSNSNSKSSSSVKDLASRFEKVLLKPKDVSPQMENDEESTNNLVNTNQNSSSQFKEITENNQSSNSQVQFNLARSATPSNCTNPNVPLKSALKIRTDYNRDMITDSQNLNAKNVIGLPETAAKTIKSVLKPSITNSPSALQPIVSPNNINSFPQRPMQPPDYATAMQRLELIRTSNSDGNLQTAEPEPQDVTDSGKKKSPKKTVTFSDEVVLVACAEYDEIDFSSNPLFERVYQQHVEAGKGEISILSKSYGNCEIMDNNVNHIQHQEYASNENSNGSVLCNLCHTKQVLLPNNYCTDCEFYLSRFKA
ncbi:inactive ubiquitin carboxyl-terminal hydrolase 54 [Trichonephila inaurata madagascariensis]|uniref:Inactive ubiquitin carboxyl-terminal hydrolase 54 n=1 Tax=Trichonephila inaurata madagascariensis TaxID=2747483 RepID=A0A8X6XW46_9ARAC|nr:inactive ubiquitin carboxyl-terminal hydrolase 54 [Trichonephila inaurata madagascariensis]